MAWNRPTSNTVDATSSSRPDGRGKMPRLRRGLIAGAIVVALGSAALWFFSSQTQTSDPKPQTSTSLIKEVTPAAAPKAETNSVPELGKGYRRTRTGAIIKVPKNPFGTPIPKDLEYKPFWEYTEEDCARVDPGYAERHKLFLEREEKSVFKTASDRVLATMIFSEPGQPSLTLPFDETFIAQFKDSIKTPIIVSHDDPPEVQEQKRAMIEARLLIKDKMDSGEDVVKFLNDERDRMKKVQGLRDNLMEELNELRRNAASVEEIKDYVNAANVMLEREGASKVHFSDKLLERSVQWNKIRLNANQGK